MLFRSKLLDNSAGPPVCDASGSWTKARFTPGGQKIGLRFEAGAFGLDTTTPLPPTTNALWQITRGDADILIELLTRSRAQLPETLGFADRSSAQQ